MIKNGLRSSQVYGGIGQSIANSILASGAEVVVTDLPGNHFDKVVSEFGFNSFAADLGNERSVETLNQNIRQNFGDVDILVTAAGGVCGQTGKSIFDVLRWIGAKFYQQT